MSFDSEREVIDTVNNQTYHYSVLEKVWTMQVVCPNVRKLYRRLFGFVDLEEIYLKKKKEKGFNLSVLREIIKIYINGADAN